ncbi:MAG: hypothetical protein KKA05_10335 [Alphaproteobacteria bacterium]|nr:hypothetical protein [Alphaproteobacteria bacterium]
MRNGHLMMSWEWWSASDSQLQVAADAFMGNLRRPSVLDQPVKAQAEWNGAKLTLRGDCLYLEGGDLYWVVGMISARPEYDSRMRGMVDKWSAWITDEAVKATGREYGPGRHKSSSSGSREAAIKALRRIGEAFFNVNLVDVTNG